MAKIAKVISEKNNKVENILRLMKSSQPVE